MTVEVLNLREAVKNEIKTTLQKEDAISRQAAIELFKDDVAVVNELNNLPPLPDRMKYVQESVNIIMNTCKSDSIKDKAFRNAARMIQNAIDGEAPDFETIEGGQNDGET